MTSPNFDDYDIIHLGISGGKDSTAALLWLMYMSRIPNDKIDVTFCDTGNEDPITYAYIDMLRERVWSRIETISSGEDIWQLSKRKGRFPSRKARFCTQFLKIIPTRDRILDHIQQGKKVLALTGVRSQEGRSSNDRGSVPAFGFDEGMGCDVYRPILDWSLEQVWQMHRDCLAVAWVERIVRNDKGLDIENKLRLLREMGHAGIPRNPLYDMGARRVGCFPCINSAKLEIRMIADYRPEKIDYIEQRENDFDSINGMSTFFALKTTPPYHRSKRITTADGRELSVPTIRDVVRWSKTAKYHPRQFELPMDEPASACDIGGYCE